MLDATSDLDPAEMRQFLRIIVEQADSMRDLIGDLLDVARIETGTLPVSPEPAELLTLVDRARNIFLLSGGKNRLGIDLAPDLPLVMVDRRRIVQVIGNLLSNAARNSPESSPIRVSAVRDGVHVEVSVADEGRGIPAERLPHLFRKFSRVESGDDRGDTGLGLAICRGIVEAHGGRIRAESDGAGLGARFTFTVPAIEAAAAGSHHPAAATTQDVNGKHSVLIVDDDPHTLRYVRQTLEDAGYVPVVTADPEEVLALVEHNRPSLVLLDLMLPGTDGIDLMRDIFGIADVPVIFLSAYGQDRVIAQAFEMGASDYVVKPFSPTELVARVGAALRRHTEPSHSTPSEPYRLGETDYRLCRTARYSGRSECGPDGDRVPAARRAFGQRRAGRDPRAASAKGMEPKEAGQLADAAHAPEEASCQTRRRWDRPLLHRRRAESRIPHGEGRRIQTRPLIALCQTRGAPECARSRMQAFAVFFLHRNRALTQWRSDWSTTVISADSCCLIGICTIRAQRLLCRL